VGHSQSLENPLIEEKWQAPTPDIPAILYAVVACNGAYSMPSLAELEHDPVAEESYRRGYIHGFNAALEALEANS
jgi:hypothetical protein